MKEPCSTCHKTRRCEWGLTQGEVTYTFCSQECFQKHTGYADSKIGTEGYDYIESPPHYLTDSGIEAIDVIEAFDLPYHLGNVAKYVLRAGKKPGEEAIRDLKKAVWYLERYIEKNS